MITEVEIYGQAELDRLCERRDFPRSALVSIGNPHWPFRKPSYDEALPRSIKDKFRDILRLEFFDEVEFEKIPRGKPKRLPQKRDIRKVIDFYERHGNECDRIVIHCRSGVSRSTAVGMVILYLIHRDEDAVIERMKKQRPYAVPHEGILKLADELLGSRLEVRRLDIMRNWKGRIRERMNAKGE
ncbi:MAG: dual specificity protein phosphatase family protein [Spirochaetaceae bacterium]|nr:dual specificity protein phosphatase family protein [Spirochaetaceae bacterium]